MADGLTEILQAASKHPNSRVSKLIQLVEEERTQKNVVLLLIELAEHAEYSVDFNVSLKYYLDLFERLGINRDLVLNEAGLLLVNSSKIYSKRVDYVQSLVERQILTLSNADDELQKQKLEQQENGNAIPAEKPKRGRKRALEAPSDPYEIELVPKKFKKLTEEKRFAVAKTVPKPKSLLRNIEVEQQIHPACWQYATIYDFENDDDIDTKRNYKLFTYHVEHRYNTLVPDINFRLHFKVKDYIDEQEEMGEDEDCDTDRSWPPLSEEYIQKYLRLENYVLQQDTNVNKQSFLDRPEGRTKEADAPVQESQQNLNSSSINGSLNCNGNTELEQSTFDLSVVNTTSETNKTVADLDSLITNETNDSGLTQSILDETNNSLDNNQINSSLETTTNSSLTETNKSINPNESQTEHDSALGASVLDQSGGNTESNAPDVSDNLNSTANDLCVNESDLRVANNSINITNSQLENDSALGTSVIDKHNTTAENSSSNTAEANKYLNGSESQTENDSTLEISNSDQSRVLENNAKDSSNSPDDASVENTKESEKNSCESTAENNRNGAVKQEDKTIGLAKVTDNKLDDEYLNKINETGKGLKIDVIQQQDKNSTQIRVRLPNGDDEGVYLSDLEDQYDRRLLSPVIHINNILPGVERKDITIVMDEELRQALEMRDGIMKHFGRETFTVPVITQEKNPNLIFNMLKLPPKMLRKKVLFKLGPDMDIYLQARILKRSRPEYTTRTVRKDQLRQWFSLKDTDMTDVYMTPPYSPGHCSDFCGFSDSADDSTSCAEFCGFTEEEQSKFTIEAISRLSRDSGVGVDGNNLDKDNFSVDRWKKILNLDETQSVENMLSQLPAEIRDVLTTELEGNHGDHSTTDSKSTRKLNEDLLTSINSEGTEDVSASNTQVISDTAESLISSNNTKESESSSQTSLPMNSENCNPNDTQKLDDVSIENCSEDKICTEKITINSGSKEMTESQKKSSDNESIRETQNNTTISDYQMHSDKVSDKSEEALLKEQLHFDNVANHLTDVSSKISDDDIMLDLNMQGNKTKIQRWHEHLQPILAKSRERHHFDVYKLGSEIIETVQSKRKAIHRSLNELKSTAVASNNTITTFHDIMDNKDKSYVSRYFLSTLLLANQSNIEISLENKSSERPTSWQDINLQLLSTKRHIVAIEDNIGMINSKQNSKYREQNTNNNSNSIQNSTTDNNQGEDSEEDKPLIKVQSVKKSFKKSKPSLKRSSSDSAATSFVADKKSKDISLSTYTTNSRHKQLPNLIERVQTLDTSEMPSTSRQAHKTNNALPNINIDAIRTLQPIQKVQQRCDDIDSGIFSIDEISTS